MGILDRFKDEDEEEDVERAQPREERSRDLPDTSDLETGEAREPGHEDERRDRSDAFERGNPESAQRKDLDLPSRDVQQEQNEARKQPPPPPPEETKPAMPDQEKTRTQLRDEATRTESPQQNQQRRQPGKPGQAQSSSPEQKQRGRDMNPATQPVDTQNPSEKTDRLEEPPPAEELERRGERDRPTRDLSDRFESASYTGAESQADQEQDGAGMQDSSTSSAPPERAPPQQQTRSSNAELQQRLGQIVNQNDTIIELLRRIAKSVSRERRSKHVERHRSL